jgi:antitoxin component of RelBE/YafQ-DinJ toxin-antitoxin module
MPARRVRLFNLRIDSVDRRRLDALSKHYALNASAVVRMLLKRAADEVRVQQRKDRQMAQSGGA